jgi:hypothetical protein
MTSAPAWTHKHADQLTDHWWWRPGWKVGTRFYAWHINTFEDAAPLHRLAAGYQAELSRVPGLDMIPLPWLHLTMQGVGFVEDVTADQVDALLRAARTRLGELDPVKARFHRPVIRPEAIALPPDPVVPVQEIRHIVRAAIGDVFGPDAVPDNADGHQPHTGLGLRQHPHSPPACDEVPGPTRGLDQPERCKSYRTPPATVQVSLERCHQPQTRSARR